MLFILAAIVGLLAALLLHGLTWTLRLRVPSVPLILGMVSALALTGFFLLYRNSDIWNLVLRAMLILYAVLFGIGYLQARSLSIPWWQGTAALFFETALAFLAGAAVNLTLQRYIPWFEEHFPGVDVYSVINWFLWTMILTLLVLAVLRPLLLLRKPRAGQPV